MSILLSQRARRVRLSPIAAAGQRASALAGQGRDILALPAGEPEFDTPEAIKVAAIAARLSFAVADTVLEDALQRIARAVAALQPARVEVLA